MDAHCPLDEWALGVQDAVAEAVAVGQFFTNVTAPGVTGLLAVLAAVLFAGGLATIRRATV